jgi:CPA2 family monovalent cation:H+ antiporter-2
MSDALLRELVLIYAIALIFIVGLARLRVPPIVAMIAAGTVAGPSGLGIVQTQDDVETLAEIGVVLLLFTVGLDFSLAELRRIWKTVVIGGGLQIGVTVAGAVVLLLAFDVPWRLGVFVGVFTALSSTAIVLKELSQRNQVDSPHGRLEVGILLFQDLCIVVLLLLVPVLSGRTAISAAPAVLGRAVLAIVAIAAVSRTAVPWLMRMVARSGRREAFPLAVLLASIGTAWASSLLGVSMALGAFLSGLMLAESEFSHQAHAEIRPMRDVLAGLFFISLGMLVEIGFVVRQLPMIAAIAALIIVSKAVITASALGVLATPFRVAVTAGIGVAQVGEFSFILGRAGVQDGILGTRPWQLLLAASIVTMIATPTLVAFAPAVGSWAARLSRRRGARPELSATPLTDHVIILGFGVGGRLVAGALRDIGVPYVILELSGDTVREGRDNGEPISYGDATNPDTLAAAGAIEARCIVCVLSDPHAATRVVQTARSLSATVPVIVRTRYRGEADALIRLGATIAVAEELEASLEVLAQLMMRLDIPGNVVEVLLGGIRRPSNVRPLRAANPAFEALPSAISKTPVATHQLQATDWAVGRTLAATDLHAATGAMILAIRRGTNAMTSPASDMRLESGDVLYLVGDDSDVLLARHRLTAGPGDAG